VTLPRVQPIIPTWRKEPFDDPDWLFEFKYDGFRGLCYLEQGRSRFVSRNGSVQNNQGSSFRLTSSTFANNTTLPISAIWNPPSTSPNPCSIDGSPGGDQSPALSWTRPQDQGNTRSFVVILYDETAGYFHWGMYNITASATGLPQNAGVSGSHYGEQVQNDVSGAAQYDGPCPPPNRPPNVHHYVFTVYALDTMLDLGSSANFPARVPSLYEALVRAGENGDILESASITGLYSTTPVK
jgi:Raf kinase inhibitor-like YbhB/YbcL family protein